MRIQFRLSILLVAVGAIAIWLAAWVDWIAKRGPAGVFGYIPGAASSGSRLTKKLLLPNTSYITNTFDSVARLTGTYLDNSANSVLDSAIYGYDKANERTAFTNAAGTYVLYAYDNLGQLRIATSSVSTENRGYLYDAAWNLSWWTNTTARQLIVDGKNELTGWAGGPGTYDGNGNRITASSGMGAMTYTYDDENRLSGVVQSTVYNSGFVYDSLGRVRKRIDYTWTGSSWYPNTATEYIYDGTRVIQERDVNNTPTVSYTRGVDLSGTMEGAGGIGGLLSRSSGYSAGNWSTHHFYHADGNGNIMYLVDGSQAMAATYRYDPFGITISSSGTLASANVYRFSSKETHINSGMYIYLYRVYDLFTLRWLNRDPIEERGFAAAVGELQLEPHHGANQYQFVLNDPGDLVDPQGLTIWLCSRKSELPLGNHTYFYDDDPPAGHSASCSEQHSSGGGGSVNPHDVPPSQNPNCTPIEGTGKPGQNNDHARAIMKCCEETMNNGAWIPGITDCHSRVDSCMGAGGGGNYSPIRHPRLGPPRVKPVFPPPPETR